MLDLNEGKCQSRDRDQRLEPVAPVTYSDGRHKFRRTRPLSTIGNFPFEVKTSRLGGREQIERGREARWALSGAKS
jgi:hypothetical protein